MISYFIVQMAAGRAERISGRHPLSGDETAENVPDPAREAVDVK
jgi:hypothetical protein